MPTSDIAAMIWSWGWCSLRKGEVIFEAPEVWVDQLKMISEKNSLPETIIAPES